MAQASTTQQPRSGRARPGWHELNPGCGSGAKFYLEVVAWTSSSQTVSSPYGKSTRPQVARFSQPRPSPPAPLKLSLFLSTPARCSRS